MKQKILILGIIGFILLSCSPKPEAIVYGVDGCHYCEMTIVDRIHAAEIVTNKGKVFKFDAVECMLNQLKETDNAEVALFLVNEYNQPGELIDATSAMYLISDDIPSPMGAFLTTFKTKEAAEMVKSEHQGELYTWEKLLDHFNN